MLTVLIIWALCGFCFWLGYDFGTDAERDRWWAKEDAEWRRRFDDS